MLIIIAQCNGSERSKTLMTTKSLLCRETGPTLIRRINSGIEAMLLRSTVVLLTVLSACAFMPQKFGASVKSGTSSKLMMQGEGAIVQVLVCLTVTNSIIMSAIR